MKLILGLLMALTLTQMAFAKNGKKYPWRETLTTRASAVGANACGDAQHFAAAELIEKAQLYCAYRGLHFYHEIDDSMTSANDRYIPTSGYGYQIYVDFDNMRCMAPKTSLSATIKFDCVR